MSENTPAAASEQGENRGAVPQFPDTLKKGGAVERVDKSQPLTPRQRRFAMSYLHSLNATEAARRAGYQGGNLKAIGSRMLRREPVKRFIAERLQHAMDGDTVILKAQILNLWREFLENCDLPPSVRLRAAENLAKYCGLLDRGQSLNVNGPSIVYVHFPDTARE